MYMRQIFYISLVLPILLSCSTTSTEKSSLVNRDPAQFAGATSVFPGSSRTPEERERDRLRGRLFHEKWNRSLRDPRDNFSHTKRISVVYDRVTRYLENRGYKISERERRRSRAFWGQVEYEIRLRKNLSWFFGGIKNFFFGRRGKANKEDSTQETSSFAIDKEYIFRNTNVKNIEARKNSDGSTNLKGSVSIDRYLTSFEFDLQEFSNEKVVLIMNEIERIAKEDPTIRNIPLEVR